MSHLRQLPLKWFWDSKCFPKWLCYAVESSNVFTICAQKSFCCTSVAKPPLPFATVMASQSFFFLCLLQFGLYQYRKVFNVSAVLTLLCSNPFGSFLLRVEVKVIAMPHSVLVMRTMNDFPFSWLCSPLLPCSSSTWQQTSTSGCQGSKFYF